MEGRSRVEIRTETVVAKRTLVRRMIQSDSLATNKKAMAEFMDLVRGRHASLKH